jgi:GNAT superfamily N-acetyltransferase
MPLTYVIEPLGQHHDRSTFICGVPELDRYLREQAGQERRRDVTAVFVLRSPDTAQVAGYYTLSAASVEPQSLPPAIVKRLPRYPTLPVLLIGRLAADQRFQGQGIGSALLMSALARSLDIRAQLGAIGVVVDAKDDTARDFYEKYGFVRFDDDACRLLLAMKTIEQLVSG